MGVLEDLQALSPSASPPPAPAPPPPASGGGNVLDALRALAPAAPPAPEPSTFDTMRSHAPAQIPGDTAPRTIADLQAAMAPKASPILEDRATRARPEADVFAPATGAVTADPFSLERQANKTEIEAQKAAKEPDLSVPILKALGRAAVGTLKDVGSIGQGIGSVASKTAGSAVESFGNEPLGNEDIDAQLRNYGIYGEKGYQRANQAIIGPFIAAADAVVRAGGAGFTAAQTGIAETARQFAVSLGMRDDQADSFSKDIGGTFESEVNRKMASGELGGEGEHVPAKEPTAGVKPPEPPAPIPGDTAPRTVADLQAGLAPKTPPEPPAAPPEPPAPPAPVVPDETLDGTIRLKSPKSPPKEKPSGPPEAPSPKPVAPTPTEAKAPSAGPPESQPPTPGRATSAEPPDRKIPSFDRVSPGPSKPGEPAGTYNFRPSELKVDAERFQFKGDGNAEGVNKTLAGVNTWRPERGNQLIVWQDKEGQLYVVDGHQRTALAKRLESEGHDPINIPGVLYREKDGVTAEKAMKIAAAKNIAEGSASIIDAAKILRLHPDEKDTAFADLPISKDMVRGAVDLAKLGNEPWRMVTNGLVEPNHAKYVGRILPDDPERQTAAMRALAKEKPANEDEAALLTKRVAASELAKKEGQTQGSLFGEDAESTAMDEVRIASGAAKQLRSDKKLFNTVASKAGKIEETGSKIERDRAGEEAVKSDQIASTIDKLAFRAGPIRDRLVALAKEVHNDPSKLASAKEQFVEALRRGEPQADTGGRGAGGAERPVDRPVAEAAVRDFLGSEAKRDPEVVKRAVEKPRRDGKKAVAAAVEELSNETLDPIDRQIIEKASPNFFQESNVRKYLRWNKQTASDEVIARAAEHASKGADINVAVKQARAEIEGGEGEKAKPEGERSAAGKPEAPAAGAVRGEPGGKPRSTKEPVREPAGSEVQGGGGRAGGGVSERQRQPDAAGKDAAGDQKVPVSGAQSLNRSLKALGLNEQDIRGVRNEAKVRELLSEPAIADHLEKEWSLNETTHTPYIGGYTKKGAPKNEILLDPRVKEILGNVDKRPMINHERVEQAGIHVRDYSYQAGHNVATAVEEATAKHYGQGDFDAYQEHVLSNAKRFLEPSAAKLHPHLDETPYRDTPGGSEHLAKAGDLSRTSGKSEPSGSAAADEGRANAVVGAAPRRAIDVSREKVAEQKRIDAIPTRVGGEIAKASDPIQKRLTNALWRRGYYRTRAPATSRIEVWKQAGDTDG
jgi:hypothetical protein